MKPMKLIHICVALAVVGGATAQSQSTGAPTNPPPTKAATQTRSSVGTGAVTKQVVGTPAKADTFQRTQATPTGSGTTQSGPLTPAKIAPMPMPPMPAGQRMDVPAQIQVSPGGNLHISPNGPLQFTNTTGAAGSPLLFSQSGWLYIYDGGFLYKVRQSDMKLMAVTQLSPNAQIATDPPKQMAKHTRTSRRHKRK
jgi:hypothetical protein